jgi:hypothetical protein
VTYAGCRSDRISERFSPYLSLVQESLLMGGDAGAVSVLSAHPLGNGYLELAEDDLHGEGPPHL